MTINAVSRNANISPSADGKLYSKYPFGASVIDGASITLTGTFPAKATAAPLFYENFEAHNVGTSYSSIGLTTDGGGDGTGSVQVSAARAYTGSKALRCDYAAGNNAQFPRIILGGLSEDEIYASCAMYWERYTTGTDPGSAMLFKIWRAGSSPVYTGVPRTYQTIRPDYSTGVIGGGDKGFVTSDGIAFFNGPGNDGTLHRDQWNRSEIWFKLSTPATADGVCAWYSNLALDQTQTSSTTISGFPTIDWDAAPTRGASDSGTKIEQVMLPLDGVDGNGTKNAYYVYIDHLYIDNTPIRVEIGDNATYAICTQRVVAPATAWSETEITVSVDSGRWSPGDTVYAFVIGADNTVAAGPFEFQVSA